MSRSDILAETLARLEAERYAPTPPRPFKPAACDAPAQLTPEQQAENLRILLDSTSDDPVVVQFRERQAS